MLFHMVNGYGYNCKNKQFNVYEHFVGNHYNLLLSDLLKKNKKNTMDFYYAVVPKDRFRKSVTAHLMNSGVLNNSIVTGNSSQCLYNIADTIRDQIKEKYENQEIFQALSSFGNGLPNLKAYEKIFCEITIESHNDEVQSNFIFSEKTWRPIAFDIPVVYLACKSQANKFIEMGYELHNHIFYDKWHSDLSLEEKLHHLVEYLEQIKGDAKIRESLVKVSHRNHKWFWENRKLEYYRQTTESFSNLLGEDNLLKRVYDCLNK